MLLLKRLWITRYPILKFTLFKRLVLSLLAITVIFGVLGTLWANYFFQGLILDYAGNVSADAARLVLETFDQRLDEKIFSWRSYFLDQRMIAYIKETEAKFALMSDRDVIIRTRDRQWQAGNADLETEEWYREVFNNPMSIELQKYAQHSNYSEVGHFGIGEIFFADLYGATIMTNRRTTDYYQADEEWWQRAMRDGLYIGPVEYDESTGLYGVTVGMRIDDGTQALGVAKVFYNLKEAEMVMKNIIRTRMENARVQSGLLGGQLVDLDYDTIYSLGTTDIESVYKDTLKSINFEKDNYYCCVLANVNGQSKEMILTVARSRGHDGYPGIGWGLVLEFEKDVLLAPLRNLVIVMLLATSTVSLLLFIYSFFFFVPIVNVLTKLEASMAKVVAGDLTVRTEIDRPDELGRLANHFDHMVAELEDATKARQDFISTATHGLKAPLTGIKWNLEILFDNKSEKLTAKTTKTLKDIYNTCTQVISTISDVLRINKLGRLGGKERGVDFDPSDFLTSLKPTLEKLAIARDRDIKFILSGDSMSIFMDKDVFKDIIENLVSNAVKYSSAGESVEVRLRNTDGYMSLEVEDHGIGIPESEQKNLFQEFYRASNATKKQIEGSGLGLYIAKSEAKAWGGDLSFTSKENEGSTFMLMVPLKK